MKKVLMSAAAVCLFFTSVAFAANEEIPKTKDMQASAFMDLDSRRVYEGKYFFKKEHKAFAYSPKGFGLCSNKATQEEAKNCAMEHCAKHATADSGSCRVVDVDGVLVK